MPNVSPETPIARREAEQALLASILVWPEIISEVKTKIAPEDFQDSKFYKGQHARIYRAMYECEHPDIVSVAAKMNEMKLLEKSDCAYLMELVAGKFDSQRGATFYWDSNDYPYYIKAILSYAGKKDTALLKGGWSWE